MSKTLNMETCCSQVQERPQKKTGKEKEECLCRNSVHSSSTLPKPSPYKVRHGYRRSACTYARTHMHTRAHIHTQKGGERGGEQEERSRESNKIAAVHWERGKWHRFLSVLKSPHFFPLQNENCLFKRRERTRLTPSAFMLKFYKTPDWWLLYSLIVLISYSISFYPGSSEPIFTQWHILFPPPPPRLCPSALLSPAILARIYRTPCSSTPAPFLFLTYHFILTK